MNAALARLDMNNTLTFDTEKARKKHLDWLCRPVIPRINEDANQWERDNSNECSCNARYLNKGMMNLMSMYGYSP